MSNYEKLYSLIALIAQKDKYIKNLPRVIFNGSNITDTTSVSKYDINKADKIRKLERTKIAPLKTHMCQDNLIATSGTYGILGIHIKNNITSYEISAYSKEYIHLIVKFLNEAEDNPSSGHKSDFFERLDRIINFINRNANNSNEFMLFLYHADKKYNLSTLYYPLPQLKEKYKIATQITKQAMKFFSFSEKNIVTVAPEKSLSLDGTNIFASQQLWKFFQARINNYYTKLTDAITRYFNLIHSTASLPKELTDAVSSIMNTIETTKFYFDLTSDIDSFRCHTACFVKHINQQITEYKNSNPELTTGKKKYITSLEKITDALLSAEDSLRISPNELYALFFSYILAENIAPLIPKLHAVAKLNNIPPIGEYNDIFNAVWDDPTITDTVNNCFLKKQFCIKEETIKDLIYDISPIFFNLETTPHIEPLSDEIKKIILCTIYNGNIITLDTLAEKFYEII